MDFLPGAFSGLIKTIISYPFETIKSNKQISKQPTYLLKDLYKGISLPLATNMFKRSIQLYTYEKYQNNNTYVAGAYGGILSSILTNPINILKTNLQTKKYSDIRSQLTKKILTKGNTINIVRDSVFSTYYLGTYGYLKKKFPNSPIYYSLSGIISGSSLWIIFSPIDCIRTMLYSNYTIESIVQVVKQNPHYLWKGCSIMILKSIPVNMVNMTSYELLKEILHKQRY